jgi:hypothetical protein
MIDLNTFRDELEHRHRLAVCEIHRLAECAFAGFLHDIGRELDGCRSLAQVRELFRPEIHNLEALAEAQILQRRDEIFVPGIHAAALVKVIDVELARVTADVMRACRIGVEHREHDRLSPVASCHYRGRVNG